jgi:NADP-dependent 3-hydroxy acid dehydrogenase YdfG
MLAYPVMDFSCLDKHGQELLKTPVLDIPISYARRAMDTNVLGVMRLAQATLPHIASQNKGTFVTIGSVVRNTVSHVLRL